MVASRARASSACSCAFRTARLLPEALEPAWPAILKCSAVSVPAFGGETFGSATWLWADAGGQGSVVFEDGASEFVCSCSAPWRRSALVRPDGRAEGSEGDGDLEESLFPLPLNEVEDLIALAKLETLC